MKTIKDAKGRVWVRFIRRLNRPEYQFNGYTVQHDAGGWVLWCPHPFDARRGRVQTGGGFRSFRAAMAAAA